MSDNWIIALGLIVPGVATGFGAMPALFMKDVSRKWLDAMLGFAAGVMLSATGFSLILPSIEYGGGGLVAVLVTAAGVLVGAGLIDVIDYFAPHEHLIDKHHEGVASDSLKKIWLFVIAIAIHNIPEGMAVGVAFGSNNLSNPDRDRDWLAKYARRFGGCVCAYAGKLQRQKSVLDRTYNRFIGTGGGLFGLWSGAAFPSRAAVHSGACGRRHALCYHG